MIRRHRPSTTEHHDDDVDRLRLLASAMAGRAVTVERLEPHERCYTDGQTIFLPDGTGDRLECLAVQSALLAAGSLNPGVLQRLPRRPSIVRRYLALEGWRSLAVMADQLPRLPVIIRATNQPCPTASAEESLALAQSRRPIPEPPDVFGAIHPPRLLAKVTEAPVAALVAGVSQAEPEDESRDADDDQETGASRGLSRLFEGPLQIELFRRLNRRRGQGSPQEGTGAGQTLMSGGRTVQQDALRGEVCLTPASIDPVQIEAGRGWRYPEWDSSAGRYRPGWCTVTESDPPRGSGVVFGRPTSGELRRRLARLAVALERRRREPQGDDIDLDSVVRAQVDVRARITPSPNVYVEMQRKKRSLSVLLLVDVSGSSSERVGDRHVLDQQRDAASLLLDAVVCLGDRAALFGFRSRGRSSVSLIRVKDFDDPLDGLVYERLGRLSPSGYTRLGAAVRHGAHVLASRGGTERRLLVVLSDGIPYDDGYEGRYGEEDARRSLAEARRGGVGCLCLSLGATNDPDTLRRVFGTAAYAHARQFNDLIPDLGRLFRAALTNAELQRRVAQREHRQAQIRDSKGAA